MRLASRYRLVVALLPAGDTRRVGLLAVGFELRLGDGARQLRIRTRTAETKKRVSAVSLSCNPMLPKKRSFCCRDQSR